MSGLHAPGSLVPSPLHHGVSLAWPALPPPIGMVSTAREACRSLVPNLMGYSQAGSLVFSRVPPPSVAAAARACAANGESLAAALRNLDRGDHILARHAAVDPERIAAAEEEAKAQLARAQLGGLPEDAVFGWLRAVAAERLLRAARLARRQGGRHLARSTQLMLRTQRLCDRSGALPPFVPALFQRKKELVALFDITRPGDPAATTCSSGLPPPRRAA